jgi:O-antigen ligase
VVLAFLIVAVPKSSWDRLLSLSRDAGPGAEAGEAVQSTESREYLLRKSLQYTIEHPVFGVGPGEFSEYEGVNNRLTGMTHGYWHDTHNTLTQVSSECGIPAALLFIAGIASTFGLLNRTYREAKRRDNCQDIRNTAFCLMLGFTAFCTATAFLNFAYFFYYPAMGGLAIAVASAAKEEFRVRDRAPEQTQPEMPWAPPVRRFPAVKPA